MNATTDLQCWVLRKSVKRRLRPKYAALAFLFLAACACSPDRSGNTQGTQGARSQTPEVVLRCEYALTEIGVGVTWREIYTLDLGGRTGRLVSSGSEPARSVSTGVLTAGDNTYEISFPELTSKGGTPIEGSALTIRINRYSGDSTRVQVAGSSQRDITHRGHCVRFDARDKL